MVSQQAYCVLHIKLLLWHSNLRLLRGCEQSRIAACLGSRLHPVFKTSVKLWSRHHLLCLLRRFGWRRAAA